MGYSRAGFDEIVGVDHKPQPRYPFEFIEWEALGYLIRRGHEFDAIHASPPCLYFLQHQTGQDGFQNQHPMELPAGGLCLRYAKNDALLR